MLIVATLKSQIFTWSQEQKPEEARAVGPVMDASFKDTDFEYLQV